MQREAVEGVVHGADSFCSHESATMSFGGVCGHGRGHKRVEGVGGLEEADVVVHKAGGRDSCGSGCKARRSSMAADTTMEGSRSLLPLLPGLPSEVSLQCLARVSDVRLLREVCRSWKNVVETSEFTLARRETGLKAVDWLYVLVRSNDGVFAWQAFDPSASKWHALPAMPEDMDFQLNVPGCIGFTHHVQCVSTGTKLVMVAGLQMGQRQAQHQWASLEPALEHPWVFDPIKCQWKKGCAFMFPRKWCVCGVVGGKVYVASGCGQLWSMSLSKCTEMYDPDSDSWEAYPLSLESSKFSGEAIPAVNVAGKLYIVSGTGVFMKVGAVFCPTTRKWSRMPEGLKVGWVGSCVAVDDNLYVVDPCVGKLSVYNPETDEWTTVWIDSRMQNLFSLTSGRGKICGIVGPSSGRTFRDEGGTCLRIITLSNPPSIREVAVPHGQAVSAQVLARMEVVSS